MEVKALHIVASNLNWKLKTIFCHNLMCIRSLFACFLLVLSGGMQYTFCLLRRILSPDKKSLAEALRTLEGILKTSRGKLLCKSRINLPLL